MDEATLIEKLLKIEALFAGAGTEGERTSAGRAKQRILSRLAELLPKDPPVEYKFTFQDMWSRKVFVTLLRRYDLKPYRYHGQRYTTVMVQVPERFVTETLWPEFEKINEELNTYLQDVTDRVVKKVLHEDSSDAVVVEQPLQIEAPDKRPDLEPATGPDNKQSAEENKSSHLKKKKKGKKGKHQKKRKKETLRTITLFMQHGRLSNSGPPDGRREATDISKNTIKLSLGNGIMLILFKMFEKKPEYIFVLDGQMAMVEDYLGHRSAGYPTPENGINQAIIPILILTQRPLPQQLFQCCIKRCMCYFIFGQIDGGNPSQRSFLSNN